MEADEERGQKTDGVLTEQARAGLRRDTRGSLETPQPLFPHWGGWCGGILKHCRVGEWLRGQDLVSLTATPVPSHATSGEPCNLSVPCPAHLENRTCSGLSLVPMFHVG